MKYTFLIPARMESTRFPNKPLKKLAGRPVLDWVYQNCMKSRYANDTIIATDSDKISKYCFESGKKFIMTGIHNCASNRVAEASKKIDDEWIVEVQGDEPLLWSKIIDEWLSNTKKYQENSKIDLFISIAALRSEDADNPNFVKTVINDEGKLLWVSRSRIPSNSKGSFNGNYYRHTGFHLWRKSSLEKFSKIKPSLIEKSEDTHAIRIVENGFYAKPVLLPDTQAIDTPDDLRRAEKILENNK